MVSISTCKGGMDVLREIHLADLKGVAIGQAQDVQGGTGCTVFLFKDGAAAGLDVRGGGPASLESELLKPLAAAQQIHAIVLSGGSAFGLDASGGVRRYLEEHGIGFDVGVTKVPLVCQSCLFDLMAGDVHARPDAAMGYAACVNAGNYRDGNYGAGTGATVGKMHGQEFCMKAGIGSYAVQMGQLQVAAVVAVNALGDIYDAETGQKIAGMLDRERTGFADSERALLNVDRVVENKFTGNTTLAVVMTNAWFDKAKLCKIAGMAHDGYARSIRPVHTSADGDSIYAVSLGRVEADLDVVGALSAKVVSKAIVRAVLGAEQAYGYPSAAKLMDRRA
jgi:L-aminopeptidase/D-esterase-like protein